MYEIEKCKQNDNQPNDCKSIMMNGNIKKHYIQWLGQNNNEQDVTRKYIENM